MALSFQNSAGAALIWNQLEEVIDLLKTKLLEGHPRADSVDSSTFNYDLLENDIFLDETTLTFPGNAATFNRISQELAVIFRFLKDLKGVGRSQKRKKSADIYFVDHKGFFY